MALTAWNQWELTRAEFADGAVVFNHLVFAVITFSVALRRTAPLACATVAAAGLVAQTVWGGDVFGAAGQFVALLVATHAVGSHPVRRPAWVGLVVVLIGVEAYPVVNGDRIVLADEIGNVSVFVAVWGLAYAVRSGQERSKRLTVEQERREREAVERERARVARELHDIVAHGLSLMVLHAGAARAGSPDAEAAVQRSLTVVEDAGRQAMAELHRLLGMLAGGRDEAVDAMVGLADVDDLCDRMRTAGLAVELHRDPVAAVDRSVELSAYRVVQEALTNALRYADGGLVTVSVRPAGDDLEVVVRDRRDGSRASPPAFGGGGRGLRGLRERVTLFGGTFTAGDVDGGWEVRATLPLGGDR